MPSLEDNIARASAFLARFEAGVKNRIGGEDVDALDGTQFETISPVDLKVLARVAHGKAADIDRAAKAARAAFRPGPHSPARRGGIFSTALPVPSRHGRRKSRWWNAWTPASR
ncbi:aldehyde dehydrogenase family protein [Pannonibacter sp. Pt2-lr]